MPEAVLLPILLQLILIFLNAIFACAEIAVISVNDTKLAYLVAQGDKRAIRLAHLTNRPAQFLSTIQIAITLSGFLGSAFAADNFSGRLTALLLRLDLPISEKALDTFSVILITLVLSYITLIFGELVPKRLAMKKSESIALALSTLISGIAKVMAPVVAVLTLSTNGVLRLLGIDPNADEEEVSEEEIQMMVDRGSQKGVFAPSTKEFIENVFAFDDCPVEEFATHRTELSFLWVGQTKEEWADIILSTNHSRYPVCEGTVDNVIGVLEAREFFRFQNESIDYILKEALRPAFFVPETITGDALFKQMKTKRNYYALVLDEYGGLLGVVTIHDLLEQLVGDIEHEGELPEIQAMDDHTWKVAGSAHLDDAAEAFGVELPEDAYDTFGGYTFGLYGSIPPDGRTATLQTDTLKIQITSVKNHKLEEAIVTRLPQPDPNTKES